MHTTLHTRSAVCKAFGGGVMSEEMSPAELRSRMQLTLIRMVLISEGKTTKLGDVIHGGDPDRSPRGPRSSMAEYHRRQWRRARSHEARAEALQAAEKALINARYAPRRSLVSGTLEWRLAIARDPRPAAIVAEVYGVSRGHVYYCRNALAKVLAT
jgi:hypothetical protein